MARLNSVHRSAASPTTSPKETRGRPAVYPWEQWFNGQKWQLFRDKTYTCSDLSMARSIRKAARRFNKDVSVTTNDLGLMITPRQRPDLGSAQALG